MELRTRINDNKIQAVVSKEKAKELIEKFSILRPGYQFEIRYRAGQDNGKHKFYKLKALKSGDILFEFEMGFQKRLLQNDIKVNIDNQYQKEEITEFLKKEIHKLPFKPRKYQLKMVYGMLMNYRHLGILSTRGGK
jgi:hypothetical protein